MIYIIKSLIPTYIIHVFNSNIWMCLVVFFFFSSRRRHTRFDCDWSSDVCSSDLIESWPHHQASPIPQSDFNARIAGRARHAPRHLHFQELCRRVFLQPLLPHEKVRPAQTVLTTKHFHTLSATCVLGNQPSPLRPRLL